MFDCVRQLRNVCSRERPWIAVAVAAVIAFSTVSMVQAEGYEEIAPAPSLRFLHGNRVFLLTRLAASQNGGAMHEDFLAFLDHSMMEAVTTLGAARRPLSAGVIEEVAEPDALAELRRGLDSLHVEARGIEERLLGIRDDFARENDTELLVALSASPEVAARVRSIELRWNGYVVTHQELHEEDRQALAQGGFRPLHRALTRPLPHTLRVGVVLADTGTVITATEIVPSSGRLTVLLLELDGASIETRVWTL